MKQFTSHLDYLIQGNDCVIIPDFGGFVLNRESASITPEGHIIPPRVVVGFNPDLKHNDGLLAESYMCLYSISYEAACKKIKIAVDSLNTQLNEKKNVRLGHLGKLKLDENGQIMFIPDQSLSLHYPDTYGLSYLNIKPLRKESARKAKLYKWYAGAAGAAAAILVFFVTSTPIGQDRENESIEKSGFFIDALTSSKAYSNTISLETVDNSTINDSKEQTETVSESNADKNQANTIAPNSNLTSENIEEAVVTVPDPSYYVIIGSARNQKEVDRISNLLKKDGIKDFDILDRGNNRFSFYIASFNDRSDAENYLIKFRKTTTKYKDAWIYANRTNS